MKTYVTSARCPKCGKQLYTSDIDGYSFVCKECDENFYTIEVVNCMADFWEINIPMLPETFKKKLSCLKEISDKYNCDFLGYDPTAKLLDIGWENSFPVSDVLNEFVKEIGDVVRDGKYTWDEIYQRADGCCFGEDNLNAKDNARENVRWLALEWGEDDLEKAECQEDEVDYYCDKYNILFDENGHIFDGYIDYAKLAIAIINEFESDREESGRREIERGMKYLLNKYTAKNERKIIDDVLMTLTGWNLKTLLEESREIDDTEA